MGRYRAQIGEQPQRLAQVQQPLLGSQPDLGICPLRAADSAEQDSIGGTAGIERLGWERRALTVERRAPDEVFVNLYPQPTMRAHRPQRARRLCGHLRTDPVARKRDDRQRQCAAAS